MKDDVRKAGLVVIGGGITGLVTAIGWALTHDVERDPVVLFEKNQAPGGCVASFRRQGYLFDTAQLIPDLQDVLGFLGIEVDLVRFEGTYCSLFRVDPVAGRVNDRIDIPSDSAAFEAELARRAPAEASGIRRFFRTAGAIHRELSALKVSPGPLDLLSMPFRCPNLVRHAGGTFAALLDRFGVRSAEVREALSVFAAFGGLSAARISALMPVGALNATMAGVYRTEGAFLLLPHALRKRLEALGGLVRTATEVRRIVVEEGRARGVVLAGGQRVEADWVVSTADPKVFAEDLVGREVLSRHAPKYLARIDAARMSVSSLTISLGLDESVDLAAYGLAPGYNVLSTGGDSFEKLLAAHDEGQLLMDRSCFHVALISPSLTVGGLPTLVIRVVPVAMNDWADRRERDPEAYDARKAEVADFYIDLVSRHLIPRLPSLIKVKDIATPATFARYLGSPTGSNYDMAPYPDNYGRTRLPLATPIGGLLQPKFSHGIWAAMQQGLQAADLMSKGKIMGGHARLGIPPPRP